MGASCSKENEDINNRDEPLTCSKCLLIPKILNIDYKNYVIEYKCPKHASRKEKLKDYFRNSKKNLYNNNQNNNLKNKNDKEYKQFFYYCKECKNFLCKNCSDSHEHKKPFLMKIKAPKNEDDIHSNNYSKYCIFCNIETNGSQEHIAIRDTKATDSLEKLINKKKKIEEKIENGKFTDELLYRLITMYAMESSSDNKNNIIKASENIIENKSEILLKKIEYLENTMSNYLENRFGITFKDNIISLNLNGKKLCDIDLILLKKSNKDLKNLENLDLGNNGIKDIGILKEFNLPNLKVLNLEHNAIDNIDKLGDVLEVNKKIEKINLSHNSINKVDVNKINDNAFQYVKEINLDGNNEIKKEINEIKEILTLNQKIQKSEGCMLKYRVEGKETKIFGTNFASHNPDKCQIYINGKECKLCENYNNEQGEIKDNILYVKMIFQEGIDDISNIFDGCVSLISISDISKWNISKVTKMNRLFNQCQSLESLPDIGKWDTSNVTTMERLFNQCYSLKSLPDIGDWDTSNVTTMEGLFYQCKSLTSLPNIGGWNTSNVTNMNYLFYHCFALKSLPNIGRWNLSKVTAMFNMFSYCESLTYLPNLSRLNISNVINLSNLFDGCSSLKSLSDISEWNTSKVQDMAGMFCDCKLLEQLPDISKWDISQVEEMDNMFKGCQNLKELPDISKWNITNVKDMNNMFNGCKSIKSFSYISKWDLSKVKTEGMFDGCEKGIIPK